jgi:hypothetical protein
MYMYTVINRYHLCPFIKSNTYTCMIVDICLHTLFLIKKTLSYLNLVPFTSILICVLLHFALIHFALMSTQNVITKIYYI